MNLEDRPRLAARKVTLDLLLLARNHQKKEV